MHRFFCALNKVLKKGFGKLPEIELVDNKVSQFEEFQSIKDDPLRKCPACKKLKLRRLIGPGAAIVPSA